MFFHRLFIPLNFPFSALFLTSLYHPFPCHNSLNWRCDTCRECRKYFNSFCIQLHCQYPLPLTFFPFHVPRAMVCRAIHYLLSTISPKSTQRQLAQFCILTSHPSSHYTPNNFPHACHTVQHVLSFNSPALAVTHSCPNRGISSVGININVVVVAVAVARCVCYQLAQPPWRMCNAVFSMVFYSLSLFFSCFFFFFLLFIN